MPSCMKNGPPSSSTVQMTTHDDSGTAKRLHMPGDKQVFTYVKAVVYKLNSFAYDSNTSKATSQIAQTAALGRLPMECSEQFAAVFCTKVALCGNAYSKTRTKIVFIDDFSASIKRAVGMFLVLNKRHLPWR